MYLQYSNRSVQYYYSVQRTFFIFYAAQYYYSVQSTGLTFSERFHYIKEHENWILIRFTDLSLFAQITKSMVGHLLSLKSIKTLILRVPKIIFYTQYFFNINFKFSLGQKLFLCCI
jgi:hypothetical protein